MLKSVLYFIKIQILWNIIKNYFMLYSIYFKYYFCNIINLFIG